MESNANTRKTNRRAYPSDARIRAVVKAARAAGVRVAAIEVRPDGTIRTIDADPARSAADAWIDGLERETGND